jgi:hypothetical protein
MAACLGTPVLWTLLGFLLSLSRRRAGAASFVTVMAIHYGIACVLLFCPCDLTRDFSDWEYFHRMCGVAITGIAVYVVGQAVVWAILARNVRRKETDNGH